MRARRAAYHLSICKDNNRQCREAIYEEHISVPEFHSPPLSPIFRILERMELFFQLLLLLLLSLFSSLTITLILFAHRGYSKHKPTLPPGPIAVPIIGNLLWLRRSMAELESILRDLHSRLGPIIILRVGSRPAIFISNHRLAHRFLIEHGAAFADRPAPLPLVLFLKSNRHLISSAYYGPLWRLLRRNLISEILHSNRIKLHSSSRTWVLNVLSSHLRSQVESSADGAAVVKESFQFAMFSLLVLMCFGEKLDESAIQDIEAAQKNLVLYGREKMYVFAFSPSITKHVFRSRVKAFMVERSKLYDLLAPLIKARRDRQHNHDGGERVVYSYVDSLLDMELPEEGCRRLTEDEIVGLCSEFLTAGSDTTAIALHWIMAELVKHPQIQRKLFEEIEGVENAEVEEEDLEKMPYLKAVILEGLRRHPPGHFVLPHAVTDDVKIDGYLIPKNASVNFMVAEMAWNEKLWENPMEFRPERFLAGGEGEDVDVTGSREIKMMPFGAGRRICPGLGLALLHLAYFVANLVREFEWKALEGVEVDLAETPGFFADMKHPLRARLIPRMNS